MKYLSKSSEETTELGKKIGASLGGHMIVALEGDLGGGKTTFTKGLAEGLGVRDEVTSPSFALEKVYQISENPNNISSLYHFDFYRIENPKDMMNYELIEALDDATGVVVVEWAEKIEKDLPEEKLLVRFHYSEENQREIEFIPNGESYRKIIELI